MEDAVLRLAAEFVDGGDRALLGDLSVERLVAAKGALAKLLGGKTEDLDFERERKRFEASVDAQSDVVVQLEAKLAVQEKALGEERADLLELDERWKLLEPLRVPLQLWVKDGCGTEAQQRSLLEALRAAQAKNAGMERLKAFRMLREKAQSANVAQDAIAAVEASPPSASTALEESGNSQKCLALCESLRSAKVEEMALPEELLVEENPALMRDLVDVARCCLEYRFSCEPDIPLYAALHHNLLMRLRDACERCRLLDLMVLCEWQAVHVLRRSVEKMTQEGIDVHLRDLQDMTDTAKMPVCVKRCAHSLSWAEKTWNDVLPAPTLQVVLESMVDHAAEEVVQFALRLCRTSAGGLSVDESTQLASNLGSAYEALLTVPGCRKTLTAVRRLRLLHQMAALETLAQLQANLSLLREVFGAHELVHFIEAAYTDNALRRNVLLQLQ